MKLTEEQLKNIISEEIIACLNERSQLNEINYGNIARFATKRGWQGLNKWARDKQAKNMQKLFARGEKINTKQAELARKEAEKLRKEKLLQAQKERIGKAIGKPVKKVDTPIANEIPTQASDATRVNTVRNAVKKGAGYYLGIPPLIVGAGLLGTQIYNNHKTDIEQPGSEYMVPNDPRFEMTGEYELQQQRDAEEKAAQQRKQQQSATQQPQKPVAGPHKIYPNID